MSQPSIAIVHRLRRPLLAAVICPLLLSSCQETRQQASTSARPAGAEPTATNQIASGHQFEHGYALARRWCAACHALALPGDLPRERWPYMIKWMGNYLGHPNDDEDVKKLIYPSFVPTEPAVTRDELAAIEAYYFHEAPAEIPPAFPRDKPLPITDLFEPKAWPGYDRARTVSLVHIDAQRRQLYLGTANDYFLRIFDAGGRLLNQINCNQNEPVEVRPLDNGFDLALMGNLGQDVREGTAHRITGGGQSQTPLRAERQVTGFYRTSGAAWGDLDGDGHDDVVMAGFGDYEHGALAWFAAKPNEEPVRHDLRPGSGSLDAVIDDVDRDGDPDILSIVAQGHQEMWWYENNGQAEFRGHLLWKERPGLGYNAFQWVDFDGDGASDIVAVSGNNMEMFDPPLKPMHGVYVYLQTGPMQFTQTHFLRMDGATKALAGDFDGDGDMDIAAISAYPDWRADSPAVFVLFTNDGAGRFTPSTISPSFSGQPITMDADDLDGDGDLDIVLGGADWAPLLPEPVLSRATERIARAPAVVALWNQSSGDDR